MQIKKRIFLYIILSQIPNKIFVRFDERAIRDLIEGLEGGFRKGNWMRHYLFQKIIPLLLSLFYFFIIFILLTHTSHNWKLSLLL